MQQLMIYGKWLKKELALLGNAQNVKWLLLYLIFCVSWFIGGHLLFLKKYKRAVWYLAAWIIMIGSWMANQFGLLPLILFFLGLALLVILFIIDIFFVYTAQQNKLRVSFSTLAVICCFSVQVLLYEYLINNNLAAIKESMPLFINHFADVYPSYGN